MTLKELRISKGLNQKECAKYLGMSVRNYQNYEYAKELENSAKYNAIYKKLEEYGIERLIKEHLKNSYNTNIVTGIALTALTSKVKKYKKRDCFNYLEKCDIVSRRFGKIEGKYVLYRGQSRKVDEEIEYINVEEFLV